MPRHPALRVLAAASAALAAGAVVARRMEPVKVRGFSMAPTLLPGDLVAVSAGARVARGDVVVVEVGGVEVVKRAVAVGGDRYRGAAVPGGSVFVAGDNLESSTDSRHYGAVPATAVRGVARLVYWPPSRWRLL